jgi:hypothetical protein
VPHVYRTELPQISHQLRAKNLVTHLHLRQLHGKHRAPARLACHIDTAIHKLYQALRNGEPQPGAFNIRILLSVHAGIQLEQSFQLFFRHAKSCIPDSQYKLYGVVIWSGLEIN